MSSVWKLIVIISGVTILGFPRVGESADTCYSYAYPNFEDASGEGCLRTCNGGYYSCGVIGPDGELKEGDGVEHPLETTFSECNGEAATYACEKYAESMCKANCHAPDEISLD